MICPILRLSSSPTSLHFACSVSTTPTYLLFLVDITHGFMFGPLHLLFPLQETLFLHATTWFSNYTSFNSLLICYFLKGLSWPLYSKQHSPPFILSLSPVLFLFNTYIIIWHYVLVRLYLLCQLQKNLDSMWAESLLFTSCTVIPRTYNFVRQIVNTW